MWFTPLALGIFYYALPRLLNRPIYSYALGVFAFWTNLVFYAGAVILWLVAMAMVADMRIFVLLVVVPVCLLGWQVVTLDAKQKGNALVRFKANHWVGLALTVSILLEAFL
jgi:cbb3-type cytochrome oxidase subunit 1